MGEVINNLRDPAKRAEVPRVAFHYGADKSEAVMVLRLTCQIFSLFTSVSPAHSFESW